MVQLASQSRAAVGSGVLSPAVSGFKCPWATDYFFLRPLSVNECENHVDVANLQFSFWVYRFLFCFFYM